MLTEQLKQEAIDRLPIYEDDPEWDEWLATLGDEVAAEVMSFVAEIMFPTNVSSNSDEPET